MLVLAMLTLVACGGGATTSSSSSPAGKSQPSAPAPAAPAQPAPAQPAPAKAAPAPAEQPAAPSKPMESTVSIGTHAQGSSYNATGTGVAKVVSENTPVKVVVKPFAGPNAWMPLLNKGELDLGVVSGPDLGWAFGGTSGFKEQNKNVRMLVNGNYLALPGFAVRKDANITKVADLKGKSVAADYAGNQIIHLVLEAQLATVGLTWDDLKKVPVTDIGTGLKAVRENRAVASFGGGSTTPPSLEADAAVGITNLSFGDWDAADIKNFPAAKLAEMRKRVPGATATLLKAGDGWVKRDSIGMSYPIALVGGAHLSDEAVYQIVKGLWHNDTKLHPIYDWLKGWKHETFFDPAPPAPYHPGAIRLFKEVGVWTADADKNQQALLARAK